MESFLSAPVKNGRAGVVLMVRVAGRQLGDFNRSRLVDSDEATTAVSAYNLSARSFVCRCARALKDSSFRSGMFIPGKLS